MKKFISMVMAAAMVVSLVPATAFAATGDVEAKAVKVVDKATDLIEDDVDVLVAGENAPVLTFKIDDAEAAVTGDAVEDGKEIVQEVKVKITGAKFVVEGDEEGTYVKVEDLDKEDRVTAVNEAELWIEAFDLDIVATKASNTSITFELSGTEEEWQAIVTDDEALKFAIQSELNKDNAGSEAKVTVTSDIKGLELTDVVYAAVEKTGIEVDLEDDVVEVAPEEDVTAEVVVIEPAIGSIFDDIADADDKVKLTLSKGFEFHPDQKTSFVVTADGVEVDVYSEDKDEFDFDDDKVTFVLGELADAEKIELEYLNIVAEDAAAGAECTLTIKVGGNDAVKLVVAKVVESGLSISVDEDEDVPVMWSGVDYQNSWLTADEDEHVALEVTIKEAFEESYDNKDEIELTLPEGVYVVDAEGAGVDVTDVDGVIATTEWDVADKFAVAYNEGDYKSFVFEKNAFPESEVNNEDAAAWEFSFKLTLVADPGFVGEVPMTMLVDGEEVGTVVIAKFESPMFVKAEQNDVKIDYRNTEIPTDIVITEAEAGLWKDGLKVGFTMDRYISFEDDLAYEVNAESEMEIDGEDDAAYFEVTEESEDEAAVVTISNISLYMERNLPAGAYDLEMTTNSAVAKYVAQRLFGAEEADCTLYATGSGDNAVAATHDADEYTCFIDDVTGYSDVVKEAWINIVTAGREQDDASFTTKVVVPVGESYIIAGESTITLDVPAYVSEAGYTMLPVRAVATALGINNNNVLWDAATKTVTILYGQRIITMTVGSKVINVNGSAIPASATVEVVNGRTFLPMRDLATALGVTDITWDAATKTATLNGNI